MEMSESIRSDDAGSRGRLLFLLVVAFFVVSSLVRFFLADFPKGVGVLPDEIRYLDLASSLLNHGELIERGGYASFQKILYPLALFPAFLADDPQMRVTLIALLNSMYLSSSVFPALLIARRLFKKSMPIIACILFTLIMPDMAYSMTFLSECVYLPLVLWIVWLAVVSLSASGRKAILLFIALGMLCFLAYLAKEVALGFVMANVLMLAIRLARAKGGERKGLGFALLAFLLAFALPFAVLKLTLFSGLLNSYDQANPSVLLDPYTLLFAFYALVSDLTHFAIAFMFFPLIVPAFTWSRLTEDERRLYQFCVLSFVFILLAVVYTISIREDLGHVGIRPHVRYVAPLFLPLLFLTIKQLLRNDGSSLQVRPMLLEFFVLVVCVMGILSLAFLGTGDYSQGFDSAQYHVVRMADENIGDLHEGSGASDASESDDIYHGEDLEINPMIWLLKLSFCIFLGFGTWAYITRKHAWARYALLGVVALCMIMNSVGAYLYNSSVYRIEQTDAEEFSSISTFLGELDPDEQVLIVCDEGSSHFNNLMDVYVENRELNYSYIEVDEFKDLLADATTAEMLLANSDATMGDNIFKANGRTNDANAGIAYVVMSVKSSDKAPLDSTFAADMTPEGFEHAKIFWIAPGGDISLATHATRSALR